MSSSTPITDRKSLYEFTTSTQESELAASSSTSPPSYQTAVTAEPPKTLNVLPEKGHDHHITAPISPMADDRKDEDQLEVLRKYNTVIVLDDSGSMNWSPTDETRWDEAKEALAQLANIAAEYDSNGIDIHFLNYKKPGLNLKTATDVRDTLGRIVPTGPTPIGAKLEELFIQYLKELNPGKTRSLFKLNKKEVKPVNFIVITDGVPTDDPESVIISFAKKLDQGNHPLSQVGIQFVQIGADPEAAKSLKDLDDSLHSEHEIRDIVDTTPYNGRLDAKTLIKVLTGGINRRIDKTKNTLH